MVYTNRSNWSSFINVLHHVAYLVHIWTCRVSLVKMFLGHIKLKKERKKESYFIKKNNACFWTVIIILQILPVNNWSN